MGCLSGEICGPDLPGWVVTNFQIDGNPNEKKKNNPDEAGGMKGGRKGTRTPDLFNVSEAL
jgi:hypothetical protein